MDVYSFGYFMWQVLTRGLPFAGTADVYRPRAPAPWPRACAGGGSGGGA